MSNVISSANVEGGSILEFSRRSGASAFYYNMGVPAAMAEANPESGGQKISEAQAQLMKAHALAGDAAEILPFLL